MRKHRTPEQWQTLVDLQRDSGLAAPHFCKQENIGYASGTCQRPLNQLFNN